MAFFHNGGWIVQFLEPDLKTSIGRSRRFADIGKVRELIERTPTVMDADARWELENDIEKGAEVYTCR